MKEAIHGGLYIVCINTDTKSGELTRASTM